MEPLRGYRKRIPPEQESYYLFRNPWGYEVNILHPDILELYLAWKKKHNIPSHIPLSDRERRQCDMDLKVLLNGKENPRLKNKK